MPSLAETLRQLARQFESLLGGGSGDSSLLGTVLGGGFGAGQASASGGSVQGRAGQIASGVLGGPLGLVASAFTSLFRSEPEPVVLPVYERPETLSLDFDIGAVELPRMAPPPAARIATQGEAPPEAARQTAAQPTVLIQVNAMDASSFSDRRDDIASAVREALTRNHSLRDEIWED